MPELPEVETIRAGLEPYLLGKTIEHIETYHPRVSRHDPQGFADFSGQTVQEVARRGKYLWLRCDAQKVILAHLRMSGQFRINSEPHPHLRASFFFTDGMRLDFLDQRTFGYLHADELVPTADGSRGWYRSTEPLIPRSALHIAPDLLDPDLSITHLARMAKMKKTRIKTLLLDQSFVSGIGNIYADEALWEAKLNGVIPACRISTVRLSLLLQAVQEVMRRSIRAGGTSFDSLYVNVNGSSGYFARELNAYGRSGLPCKRCGTPLIREAFMGRSSTFCPKCQSRRK